MKSNVKSCLRKILLFDFYSIRYKNEGVSLLYTDVTACIASYFWHTFCANDICTF